MKHILIFSLVFVAVWQDEILSTTRSKLFSLKGRQSSNKCRIWLMTHKNGGSVWGTEDRISWENRTKFPWDGNFNEISRWERTPSRRQGPKLSTSPFEEQDSGDQSSIVFSVHSKNFQHIFLSLYQLFDDISLFVVFVVLMMGLASSCLIEGQHAGFVTDFRCDFWCVQFV